MAEKEESKELIKRQEVDILELKETLRLRILSEDIEVGIIIVALSFFLFPSIYFLEYEAQNQAEDMALWIRCLRHKHKDPCLDPQPM